MFLHQKFEEICDTSDDELTQLPNGKSIVCLYEEANPEEYSPRTVYIPTLDALVSDMICRFGKQHKDAVGPSLLVHQQSVRCAHFKPL
jgi:hypothetical protein